VSVDAVDLNNPDHFVPGVPHEHFRCLRQTAPVSYTPRPDGGGFWSVTRHADIELVEADPARFTSTAGLNIIPLPQAVVDAMSGQMLIWNDPPRHTLLRRIISKGFTPRRVELLESRVREMARDCIDAVIERGECDLVEVAAYLPVEVIAELLGVPESDRGTLFSWTTAIFGVEDPDCSDPASFSMAMMQMFSYARRLASRRRIEPSDDIFSAIATAEVDGEQLTEIELGVFFLLLATAGNETTRTLLLQSLLALIEHPGALAELRADHRLLPNAIEEMLRWSSPVHCFGRTTTEAVELGGQQIAAGEQVIIWYASGNRDEAVFTDPMCFDIHRDNARRHLAFGTGPHFCLGASLARLEAKVFFEEFLPRVTNIELTAPPTRLRSNFTNGIKRMPIRFTPGRTTRPADQRPTRPAMTLDALRRPAVRVIEPTQTPQPTQPTPPPAEPLESTMTIELVPLATATLEIGAPVFIPNGPKGTRVIAEITSSVWDGDRLHAKQVGVASADWALISDDGTAAIDVRSTLETDDGALIYVSYQGRTDYSLAGAGPLYAAPTFETGDPRYSWLNKVQAIARGTAEGLTTLTYDVFEVR
jgi:cytochrome P450